MQASYIRALLLFLSLSATAPGASVFYKVDGAIANGSTFTAVLELTPGASPVSPCTDATVQIICQFSIDSFEATISGGPYDGLVISDPDGSDSGLLQVQNVFPPPDQSISFGSSDGDASLGLVFLTTFASVDVLSAIPSGASFNFGQFFKGQDSQLVTSATIQPFTPVPEPATGLSAGLALAALAIVSRSRRAGW